MPFGGGVSFLCVLHVVDVVVIVVVVVAAALRKFGRNRISVSGCRKRPKKFEDSYDLDENLTESIAAMKTIISTNIVGSFQTKTARKLANTSRKLHKTFRKTIRAYILEN